MKKNNKGFTLIELLAVIVILGLLMAIAIPSVTRYITQSRKKTLVGTMDSYITAATSAVNENEFGAMSNQDTMYYIPVSNDATKSCISLEKGGTDPFGNWKEAYVVVNYDAENYSYDYYFTFYDDAGYGMELTKIEDIDGSKIKNPSTVNADNITTQLNDRATNTKVLVAGSCNVDSAVSVIGGNNNNQNNENSLVNLIKKNNTIITAKPTLTTSSNNSSDASGLYVSNDTNSGQPTYYFRGSVTNNNVKFAGLTWKIVRINEDGTTRLILNDRIGATTYPFTTVKNMYYSNSDTAKPTVDTWYQTNIAMKGYDSYVATSTFCEQAKVKYFSDSSSGNASTTIPSSYISNFKCSTDGNGKGIISGKAGLITYDEALHAGGYVGKDNPSNFLSNANYYIWTMSTSGQKSGQTSNWYIGKNGELGSGDVTYSLEVCLRPVINLNANVLATGTGTSLDPYVVQTN